MVGNDTIRVGLFQRPTAAPVVDSENQLIIEHVSFLTDKAGFEEAIRTLDSLGIAHEAPEDTGIAQAVVFKDVDGHNLEITYYY
jgi:hypothetical protein